MAAEQVDAGVPPARRIVHVTIRGRVQGVAFRAWTEDEALRSGLEGWVRNRRDGSVEAVIAGPAASVEDMVGAFRDGPPGARVDGVEEGPADCESLRERNPGERFSILPTR